MPDTSATETQPLRDDGATRQRPESTADMPSIVVRGDFIDRVAFLADSSVSLVTCLGYVDDHPTLVPFVDVTLFSSDDEVRRVVLSEMMTLDNMTGLLGDLTVDLRSACRELNVLARGAVAVEPARLRSMRTTLTHMVDEIRGCLEDLESIAQDGALQADGAA